MFNKLFKKDSSNKSAIHLDFEEVFPHIFWTSAWIINGEFPAGVRYKIFTARDKSKNEIDVVIIQETHKSKLELLRASIPLSKFDINKERNLVDMIEQKFQVKLDRVDMSTAITFDEFENKSKDIGWEVNEN